MLAALPDIAVAAAIATGFPIAAAVGRALGRRASRSQSERVINPQLGTLLAAMLGLLALLLGFSFSIVASRFHERQQLIVREANAIGTAFLRADLLEEPSRDQLRTALKTYTSQRQELLSAQATSIAAAEHLTAEME